MVAVEAVFYRITDLLFEAFGFTFAFHYFRPLARSFRRGSFYLFSPPNRSLERGERKRERESSTALFTSPSTDPTFTSWKPEIELWRLLCAYSSSHSGRHDRRGGSYLTI